MAFTARSKRTSNRSKRPIAGRRQSARTETAAPQASRSLPRAMSSQPSRLGSNPVARQPIPRINPRLRPIPLTDNQLPGWLQKILKIQQGVWIGTVTLSLMTLGVYGWSVYSQQQWGQAYRHLDQLRRNERQLISNSEMMKNQIAERVDAKNLGLAPQVANDVIFLQPAQSSGSSPQTPPNNPAAKESQPSSSTPLGY